MDDDRDRYVAVLPGWRIPIDEITFRAVRSSGPGGQNVNKVNTKVELRWSPSASRSLPERYRDRLLEAAASRLTASGDLIVTSSRFREQHRNRESAIERFQALLRSLLYVPPARRKTRPTRTSKERRVRDKKALSTKKQDRRRPLD